MISETENFNELKLIAHPVIAYPDHLLDLVPTCPSSERTVYQIEESCAAKLKVLHVDGANRSKLASIGRLTSLSELRLEKIALSEDEFRKIASLPLLKTLRLKHVHDDDKGVDDFGCLGFTSLISNLLVELVELELSNVNFVNDGTMRMLKAQGKLKKLVLTHTYITDAGLEHISNLTELIELDISYNLITDSGLKHLSNLTKLKNLNISSYRITDAGLKHLSNLTKLKNLNISSNLTVAGFECLLHLENLNVLNLRGNRIIYKSIKL